MLVLLCCVRLALSIFSALSFVDTLGLNCLAATRRLVQSLGISHLEC